MIIGVAGTFGAGKDTIADYLVQKKGFQHVSLSDIISEEAEKRNVDLTDRDAKRLFSDSLAVEWGRDVLAKIALKKKNQENIVLSSIRKAEEVDYLKDQPHFRLIFVDANIDHRHHRMVKRGRPDEVNLKKEDIEAKEALEMSGQGSQNIGYCKEKADILIDNSGTIEELYHQIDKILE